MRAKKYHIRLNKNQQATTGIAFAATTSRRAQTQALEADSPFEITSSNCGRHKPSIVLRLRVSLEMLSQLGLRSSESFQEQLLHEAEGFRDLRKHRPVHRASSCWQSCQALFQRVSHASTPKIWRKRFGRWQRPVAGAAAGAFRSRGALS